MKSLTCKHCTEHTHIETGTTEREVLDKMWEHNKTDHKEEAGKAMALPKEEQDKMMDEARSRIKDN